MSELVDCPECGGFGFSPRQVVGIGPIGICRREPCRACLGKGKVRFTAADELQAIDQVQRAVRHWLQVHRSHCEAGEDCAAGQKFLAVIAHHLGLTAKEIRDFPRELLQMEMSESRLERLESLHRS